MDIELPNKKGKKKPVVEFEKNMNDLSIQSPILQAPPDVLTKDLYQDFNT
jgi:hypothetical protein